MEYNCNIPVYVCHISAIRTGGILPAIQGVSCQAIDILAEQINDLTGRDVHFRFGDQKYRRSRVFLDFL